MVEQTLCPCGSNIRYSECCELIHQDHRLAIKPEQLMRARFSAHVLKLVDFVIKTYHISCDAESEREGIAQSVNLDWTRLEIIDAPITPSNEGFVEFKAYMNEDGNEHCMQERSRFLKEDGLWFYVDGVFQENEPPEDSTSKPEQVTKVGRNDPCLCGSGKKYKKCCG